ncbi:MAG: hypothetical protein QM780_01050 [Hyphomicrobium sp.]|uniref:hypothetical protein n=1 Tax=Hyphomicrobium sp. TaxID=82 RepID=UPI0039E720D4
MRSSLRSIGPAAFFALFMLLPGAGAFAENASVENSSSDGSQIEPAGADSYVPQKGNLNSVPEDESSTKSGMSADNPLVKQIMAARPGEDLVICVAGCYTGRNRVVYAQPSANALRGTLSPQTMLPVDPRDAAGTGKPNRSASADPRAPLVINRTN